MTACRIILYCHCTNAEGLFLRIGASPRRTPLQQCTCGQQSFPLPRRSCNRHNRHGPLPPDLTVQSLSSRKSRRRKEKVRRSCQSLRHLRRRHFINRECNCRRARCVGRRAVKPDATDFAASRSKVARSIPCRVREVDGTPGRRLSRRVGAAASEAIKFTAAAAPAIPS